jgi:porin
MQMSKAQRGKRGLPRGVATFVLLLLMLAGDGLRAEAALADQSESNSPLSADRQQSGEKNTANEADIIDESPSRDGKSRSGIFSGKSVLSDLSERELITNSVFPAIGSALLAPIYKFRDNLDIFELNFSTDYSNLVQHASSTLSGEDTAASQVFRILGTWLSIGDADGAHGHLVWKGEYRGAFGGNPTPRDMGFDTGSVLSTANYKEMGWGVTDLYWTQHLWDNEAVLLVGHMDAGDWADQYPLLNAWKRFLNDAFYNNPTESIPKRGFGLVGHSYLSEHLFIMGGVHDANGPDDRLDFDSFWNTRELMTWVEFGYRGERDISRGQNFHLHLWQQDAREEAGTERSKGVTFTYSNVTAGGAVPFVRIGYSEGDTPQMRRFIGVGTAFKFFERDTLGIGTSWGSPPDKTLRDQVTSEVFYRVQLTPNVSLTPNLQVYYQPSNNPEKDWISVVGLRFRLTF